MARNMYKSAMATGLASGKMRASMYDMASLEGQKKMEDVELSLESEKLNRNIGVISDTLSLASTVAGRYGDISEDVSSIEYLSLGKYFKITCFKILNEIGLVT